MRTSICIVPIAQFLLYFLSVSNANPLKSVQRTEIALEEAQVTADPQAAFHAWAVLHIRSYLRDPEEKEQRFRNWMEHVEHVAAHRQKNSTMQLGISKFADMSDAEFRRAYLGQSSSRGNPLLRGSQPVSIENYRYRHDTPPAEVDWRKHGVVGPIKDQHVNGAPCGCCWSFATTGIAECINAMYTGEVVALSEQQLIDCDHTPPYIDAGCEGGDFTGGLHYIITHGGINTEEDYPYIARDDKCNKKAEAGRVVTLDAWEAVPPGNETALMQAVARHPVAVGMCCGDYLKDWHAYKGGIFDSKCCSEPIDHAVVVVGYGSENGQDYWLVKNSWGVGFGEQGFIKFKRGLGGFGHCSIAHEPAFAIKTHPNPPAPKRLQPATTAAGIIDTSAATSEA